MNYEEKQEARRDGLRAKADRVEADGIARGKRATALGRVMNGQPILIGHHSEKRHRRDIDRMDRDMRAYSEGTKEATDLRRKADAVGSGGISSDDENAVTKLHERIEKKEQDRDRIKKINKLYRSKDADGLKAMGYNFEELKAKLADAYSWEKAPFPKWQVTNLGATIRADKKRLDVLKAQFARADETPTVDLGSGICDEVPFHVVEDREENRVIFYFDSKPSRRALDMLKSHGWRYSPNRNAHVRKISSNAVHYGRYLVTQLVEATQ